MPNHVLLHTSGYRIQSYRVSGFLPKETFTNCNVIKLVEIYSEVVQSKIKFDHVGIDCIKIVFVY